VHFISSVHLTRTPSCPRLRAAAGLLIAELVTGASSRVPPPLHPVVVVSPRDTASSSTAVAGGVTTPFQGYVGALAADRSEASAMVYAARQFRLAVEPRIYIAHGGPLHHGRLSIRSNEVDAEAKYHVHRLGRVQYTQHCVFP